MNKQFLNTSNKILILGLFLSLIICDSNYGQQVNKIFDYPGGSSGSANKSEESNDNTMLYIVGGAVVVGIVVYALMRDKKEKPTSDTTAVIYDEKFLEQNLSFNEKVSNAQSQILINISFGMQRDKVIKDERRYFVGLNYNF